MEDTEVSLNRIIHERSRLLILGSLAGNRAKKNFAVLRDELGLTGGNLSVHLSVLEEAGYIVIKKKFVNKKPQTEISITDSGAEELDKYLTNMEKIISELKKKE